MSANGDTSSTASGSSAAAGKGKKPIGEVTKVVIDRSKIRSFSDAGRKNLLTSISSLLETFSSAEKKDGVARRFNSLLNHCDYVHERDLKLKERTNKGKALAVALLAKAGENDKVAEEKVTNYEQRTLLLVKQAVEEERAHQLTDEAAAVVDHAVVDHGTALDFKN